MLTLCLSVCLSVCVHMLLASSWPN
jgi:hypothetical protein